MNIKMIAAASLNGVIGQNNGLPWENEFPEDMAFFRKSTANSTVIMGRKTYESIGRPLPKRRNIVITSNFRPGWNDIGINQFTTLDAALETCGGDVWIIGGSFVYQEGLKRASEIHVTTIPKIITGESLVYFPYVNPDAFKITDRIELNKDKNLFVNVYSKI